MARQATAVWGEEGETKKAGTNTPLATFQNTAYGSNKPRFKFNTNRLPSTYSTGLQAFSYAS